MKVQKPFTKDVPRDEGITANKKHRLVPLHYSGVSIKVQFT